MPFKIAVVPGDGIVDVTKEAVRSFAPPTRSSGSACSSTNTTSGGAVPPTGEVPPE